MLDPYALEEIYRMEEQLRAERHLHLASWREREPRGASQNPIGGVRRRVAQALLLLADRLDPRIVVSGPHVPAAPALNGTLHHA